MRRAVHHSAVWLIVPLWALFVGISLGRVAMLMHDNRDFTARAQRTQGVVLKKVERLADTFSGARIYVLVYQYEAENIRAGIRAAVDRETFDRVHVGGPIPIAYLPGDARHQCIDFPWELSDMAWVPFDNFVVAMLVFVPGVFLTSHFGRRNRIYARLRTTGVHTWGEVTALKKTHHRCNSDTYLIFHFRTATGREIAGRSPSLTSEDHTNWKVGDPVSVLYDLKNPNYFRLDVNHPLDGAFDEEPRPPVYETLWA